MSRTLITINYKLSFNILPKIAAHRTVVAANGTYIKYTIDFFLCRNVPTKIVKRRGMTAHHLNVYVQYFRVKQQTCRGNYNYE